MDEKDIENSSEFENLKEEEQQEEKQEENSSMLSFNSAEISDGLEEFEGLFDEVQEEKQEETIKEIAEEPLEETSQEDKEEIEANFKESLDIQKEQTQEEQKLASDFAMIFENDSLAENNSEIQIENEFQEFPETQQIHETQEIKIPSEIMPDIADDFEEEVKETTQELITVRPVRFQQFENVAPNRSIKKNLDIMQDVSMHISVELGRTKSSIKEVMEMETGSIVELDKIAGEQVEIFVNEKLVAKGEVIVIEDKFGVRVTSTNA